MKKRYRNGSERRETIVSLKRTHTYTQTHNTIVLAGQRLIDGHFIQLQEKRYHLRRTEFCRDVNGRLKVISAEVNEAE